MNFVQKTKVFSRHNFKFRLSKLQLRTYKWRAVTILCLIGLFACIFDQLYVGSFTRFFEKNFCPKYLEGRLDSRQFNLKIQELLVDRNHHLSLNNERRKIPFGVLNKGSSFPNDSVPSYGLVVAVKSAIANLNQRLAIRATWGNTTYLRRYPLFPKLETKLIFMLGQQKEFSDILQNEISEETVRFGDLFIGDFVDVYENNTYKTLMALHWAVEEKMNFEFLAVVDDDIYFSVENLVEFLKSLYVSSNFQAKNEPLYMGKVYPDSRPVRNVLGQSSQWYVSLHDYPYNYYPPYVAGAAVILSQNTTLSFYLASKLVPSFPIDDVYLGILAMRLGIIPEISYDFIIYDILHHHDKSASIPLSMFKSLIVFHGLKCPRQLRDFWLAPRFHELQPCANRSS